MDNKENNQASQKRPMGGPMGPMAMGKIEKAKDFKGSIGKLLKYMGEYKLQLVIVLVFAIISTVFNIVGPKILGNATTEIFKGLIGKIDGSSNGINFKYIGNTVLWLLGLYIVSSACLYIQNYIVSGISMKVTYKFRKEISEKINRLPLKYYDKKTHGEILSRVTNDIDTVSNSLNQSATQIITSVTLIIGIIVMMFSISISLTLVTLITLPLSFGLIGLIMGLSQKYFKSQQEYLGHLNGHVEEMYSGHTIVKAFNGEKASVEKFNDLNKTLYKSAWKSQFLTGLLFPMINFIGNISYVVVCIFGGYLAVKKTINVGDIQAFIQYVRTFNQPLAQVAQISNILQQTAAAAERVFEFLEEDEEVIDTNNSKVLDIVKGEVEFKNVRFGYNSDKIVINDFSMIAKPGMKVAIVGPTGAGKTTLVKLLMRFYDLDSGEINIDGINIKDFTRKDLRDMIAMVLQDTWLYNGSIKDNIHYGKLDATDEEILNASTMAHVEDFVHSLPDGYNMEINEEANNISQGQKQLITIARAILKDPKILILDEATSSVDTRTEVLIQRAMNNLMQNRTSFIIAHRLSTIKNADLILVINNGDIVEQGKHEELLSKDGFYAKLYNSQFEVEEAV